MTFTEANQVVAAFVEDNNFYDRNTFKWGSEDGKETLTKDLTMTHLCHIINWILDHDNQYNDGTLAFFVGEAKYRRLLAFAENTSYVEATGVKYGSNSRAVLVNP